MDNLKKPFLEAIENKTKIKVTFYSKEDQKEITRLCAPMDYGPSRKVRRKNDRFHLWDYDSDSDKGSHTLSLNPEQIVRFEVLDDYFTPSEFISWKTNWIITRNWGEFS